MLIFPNKDPDDVLDYQFDWSARLLSGEQIATVEILVDSASGLVVDSHAFSGSLVTTWLSGGIAGTNGSVTCRITTNQARTYDQSAILRIRNL